MKKLLTTAVLAIGCLVYGQKDTPTPISYTSQRHDGKIRCATMENDSIRRANNPALGTLEENEQWLQGKIQEHQEIYANTPQRAPLLTIPVVVHVIHNGDAVGTGENIADGQVLSQIQVLNEDFRKMAGTNGDNSHPDGADIEIEFCMAQQDPSGNPTDGINRVNMGQATWNSMASIDGTLKPATQWDPTLYMNMWTVRFGGGMAGTLGYAQFPDNSGLAGLGASGGAANSDGVVMSFDAFGSSQIYPAGVYNAPYDLGRTTTHEVGHWLGLRHIWGDGACGVDDFCADTPTSDASNFGCPTGHVSCGTTDMIENYMDYTDDGCMNIFTEDQKTRMRTVMSVSPRRMELPLSNKCSPAAGDDAGLQVIISPNGSVCGSTTFIPEVTIINTGSNTLTSVDIYYNVDGGANSVFNWTGSLTTGATENVVLPSMSTTVGAHTFNAFTDSPNGNADGNPGNDANSSNFTVAFGTAVTLSLTTDCWGYETYWELEDANPTVVESGGNAVVPPGGAQIATAADPGAYGSTVTITENWCLADGCYDFTIYDDYGDGMYGSQYGGCTVDGDYTITEDATSTVLASLQAANADFGNSETVNFCIVPSCTSDAGTMVTSPTLEICGTGAQTATHNGDETNDGDDAIQYVLHDNAGTTLGTITATSSTPTFSFTGGMTYGTTYYISAIVGNDTGGGVVDQADPCLSVAAGTPVIWHDLPTVGAGADQEVCAGTAVTLNGTGATSYSWDNGVTDGVAFTPGATQTYTVTGTDANSCQNTDQVVVTVNALPTVSAGADQEVCAGTSVTLNGSGATSYSWNNGVTDGVAFTPAVTQTYTVTGTDANACQNTDQVVVTVNALPTVSAGPDQGVCPGGSVTLNGSGAVSYSWDNGVTNGVAFTPGATQTYTVTGTDANACQNTDQVVVTVHALPTVSAGADQSICIGGSVTLNGSGAVSYSWDNGVTDGVAFSPGATQTYTVTGTDGNSCQNTDQVVVTVNALPTVSAGADQEVCAGTAVTLNGSGATSYSWDNGVTDGVAFTPGSTQTYTVTGTDANACQNTDQVVVTVNTLPTVSAGADQGVCPGGSVTLNGSGAVSYSWDNGVTNGVAFTPGATQTYTVTGTDANTCQNTDQVVVTVHALPTVSAGADQDICAGSSITLSGSGAVSYSWDNGVTNGVSFAPASTQTYTVTGTDANSCQNTDQVTITVNPVPSVSNISTACDGTNTNYTVSFDVSGGSSPYTVTGATGSFAGSTWTSDPIPSGTPYNLTVEDQNGCAASPVSGVENCSCTTDAGSMNGTTLTLCGNGSQTAIHNGDETFDADDVMQFVLHDNSGASLGTVTTTSGSPTFSFVGGMTYGTTYYISAIVGNDSGGGVVDLSDPCLSVAPGTPVIWNDLPTVSAGTDQEVCAGTSVTLNGSGAASYSWNNGVTDGVAFTPGSTLTYTVTGTDANSCQNTDQVVVTVNALPTVSAGADQEVCAGTAVTLNGSGASSYSWNNGVTNGVAFTPGSTLTYTVTGTDANACQNTDQVVVTVNALPTVSAGADQEVCAGTSVTLNGSGASSYSWDNGVTNGVSFTPGSTQTYTVTGTDANSCQNTDQVVVTVNALPTVSAGADQEVCQGSSVTLAGSGAVSYSWDNGVSNGVSFVPGGTQTYTVIGTDANSCQNTDQLVVTVNSLPSVSAGADQAVCDGNSVTLSGSGASSYAWDNGVTDGVAFTPAGSQTYTVVGTDANGCQNSDQVLVTVNGLPTVDAGADQVVCAGTAVTLNGSGANSYTWDNGVTDGVAFTPASTLTYTVTGTDANACQNTDQVTVTVNPLPTFTLNGTDPTICGGTDGSIEISGLNGTTTYNITYNDGSVVGPTGMMSNGAGIITINSLSAGNYANFVVELNGCSSIDAGPITLSDPTGMSFSTNETDEFCSAADGSIVINATGGSGVISYSIDNGANFGTSNTFNGLAAGTYDIIVMDALNCQVSGTATINDNPAPIIDSIIVSPVTCAGMTDGAIDIYATGGTTMEYSIDNGTSFQASSSFTNVSDGTYDIVVTDLNGCTTNGQATVSPPDSLQNSFNIVATYCGLDNGSIEATTSNGTAPYSYAWEHNPGNDTSAVYDLAAGVYVLVTTDANGCFIADSITVNGSAGMDVPATVSNESCPGQADGSVVISGVSGGTPPYNFSWDDGSDSFAIYQLAEGTYSVTISDASGCMMTEVYTISVDAESCAEDVVINNAISPNGDGDNDVWIIEGIDQYPNASVEIFNRWGASLYTSDNYQNDWDGTYNGDELPAGVYYFIIVISEDEVYEGSLTLMR